MNRQELASYLDITIVKNNHTMSDAEGLASLAAAEKFACVFTMPCYLDFMLDRLKGTGVNVGGVVAFPWGAERSDMKAYAAAKYVEMGADEIDMVINIGYLFDKRYDAVLQDIKMVRDVVPEGRILKCIVESGMLSREQIETVTSIVADSGADYIKTGTGFNGSAELWHVDIMSRVANGRIKVKAAGGIRTAEEAEAFINAGCSRLGIGYSSVGNLLSQMK